MVALTRWLDATLYPDSGRNWDDELFRACILEHLESDDVVLDLGAGAGIVKQMNFKNVARRVCGVDLDPRVVDNPMLDEGRVCDASAIPYDAATFDLVFADNVLEHLAEPGGVFQRGRARSEAGRRLPLQDAEQVALCADHCPADAPLVPRGRQSAGAAARRATYFRRSTAQIPVRTWRHWRQRRILTVISINRIERRPEYLRFSAPTYLAGAAYERLVNMHTAALHPCAFC